MERQRTGADTEAAGTPPEPERFVTFGQRFQKWSTYISVDWVLNYITGMLFSVWGRYTDLGRTYWSGPLRKAATYVCKDVLKIGEAGLPKSVGNTVGFFSIIAGGMFTIPPLMVLESKHIRKSMIRWYDKKYYGEERVRDDPRFAQAYAGLDEMHKQGFWTGLFSRIGALTPLLLTVMLDKPREWSEPYFDGVAKGSGHVYTAVGLTKERLYKHRSPAERDAEWQWLHKENSAIDFGLEPWYAVLHMIFYRTLAKWVGKGENKLREHEVAKKEAQVEKDEAKIEKHERKHEARDETKLENKIARLETDIEKDQQRIAREKPDSPRPQVHSISHEEHQRQVAQVHALAQTPV